MAQVCLTASIVGFLCCLSVLNACKWDLDTELEQGLDISSFDNGAAYLADQPEISDAEQCQNACCERDDCQLAVIGTPADGRPECRLVSCMKDGKDVCVLTQSTQFKVYRKILDSADQKTQIAAEVRSVNTTDHCRLPSVVGNCRAAFPRFYYDVISQTCKQFVYGGCGGNDNNFNSQEECEASCSGVTASHTLITAGSRGAEGAAAPPGVSPTKNGGVGVRGKPRLQLEAPYDVVSKMAVDNMLSTETNVKET
ncbi:four-domain proteases inhibitor-like [Sinocyclocheilus grahami]|uniref:four-domain proteases inhibitor-like n=1 Tax=Sinocyclocheilus grahami TaxID=75366 RepID=UPI0007AD4C89|nr:PREDICTED: four-domain proteases inhibitor-like [Sinocyclocheilus grahami]